MATVGPLYLRDDELQRALTLFWLAELELARTGLGPFQRADLLFKDYLVLFFVAARPGTTVAELTQLLGASKQALSRHVIKLRGMGLLAESAPAADRRRRPLVVTEKGRSLLEEAVSLQKRLLRRGFRQAGPEAVGGFVTVLSELVPEKHRAFAQPPASVPERP